ncbi:hypothetical protein J3R30DRAFT_3423633 [Lentinula aciculospora]|uniref:Uncharacterized protein n=1 Tax=Lentinula aciculospora TaxID=153920 RepID=A0A9W9AU91_9AGAR|nr:hypothetical protein J3R30DRAFT_3423633 [Lentinula aciculospora]
MLVHIAQSEAAYTGLCVFAIYHYLAFPPPSCIFSLTIMDRKLAPEIIEHIIDQLQADKATLLATSLSCKGMLLRSRFHLFNSLEITILTDPSGWSQGRQSTDPRSLSALLDILDTSYSSMGLAVQRLIISFGFHFPQTLPSDLSRVRKNLRNVQTLHWRDDTWCDVPMAFKSLMFGLSIHTFIISGVWFQKAAELVEMITTWPCTLQSVIMGSIVCSGDDTTSTDDTSKALSGRNKIHFQTLHSASTWAARNLFSSLISSSMLTIDRFIVGLRFPDEEEVQWVNGMLSRYGSGFSEVLHLIPVPIAIELRNRDLPVFDLRDCINLRVLHIQSIYLGCSMSNIQELLPLATSSVKRVISSIPNSDLLEEIRIRFEIDLSELEMISNMPSDIATLPLDINNSDCVPFMDQFARFHWAEFAKFLLDIHLPELSTAMSAHSGPTTFLNPTSPFLKSRHSSPRHAGSRRIHIELGAYPVENKLFEEIFVKNYDKYVHYIYENGLKLVEREGSALVFSQVGYLNSYEV